MKFIISLSLSCIFLLQAIPVVAHSPSSALRAGDDSPAPSASPTPDVVLENAKRRAQLAEENKKAAEAEKAELEARRAKLKASLEPLGDTSKITALSGNVTTDQGGFVEVRMLSLEAAREISGRLAGVLCSQSNAKTLVIYDRQQLKAIAVSRTMATQLDALSRELGVSAVAIAKALYETNPDPSPRGVDSRRSNNKFGLLRDSSSNLRTFGTAALAATAVPDVASGVISSIAQLANLFRTETELKNKDVAIPEDMAVSYLVSGLASSNHCGHAPDVYYPNLYPTNLFENNSNSALMKAVNQVRGDKKTAVEDLKKIAARIKQINEIGAAIDERDNMMEQRTKLQAERAALLNVDPRCRRTKCRQVNDEISTLSGDIAFASRKINGATNGGEQRFSENYQVWLKTLKQVIARTQLLIDTAEEIIVNLDKADDATNTTMLVQLLQAEQLGAVLIAPSTYMLRVAVAANGTTKIKKNIFIDAKVRHTAGADLIYQLFDNKGRVVMGDVLQEYFDYKSSAAVREQVAKGKKSSTPTSGPKNLAAVSKRQ